ncbi:cupin domain-containing protein [Chelonobacter oris]|uniref:hypothetical protein n=1 Tax=Chelonobacter oris TaxID=505317 RepID=UPI00068B0992|nr:hypothetical protein [Chelonobacter oris]
MKKWLMASALMLGTGGMALGSGLAGSEIRGEGKIVDEPNVVIYQNTLAKNARIERHNYPDSQALLFFTVTKGKVSVLLNDSERHEIETGTLLRYRGSDFVQSTAQEDSVILVTIIPSQAGAKGAKHGKTNR